MSKQMKGDDIWFLMIESVVFTWRVTLLVLFLGLALYLKYHFDDRELLYRSYVLAVCGNNDEKGVLTYENYILLYAQWNLNIVFSWLFVVRRFHKSIKQHWSKIRLLAYKKKNMPLPFTTQSRFLTYWGSSLLRTLWAKENMIVFSIFSFSHKTKNILSFELHFICHFLMLWILQGHNFIVC